MKKLFFAFAALLFFVSTEAQKGHSPMFSISGNIGPATTSSYTISFGGDLQVAFPTNSNFALLLSAGYQNYHYKITFNNSTVQGHSSYIPVLGGVKVPFSTNLYGEGKIGYAFSTVSGGSGGFAYTPVLGYKISPNVDLSAQYMGISFSGGNLGAVLAALRINFGN